MPASRPEASGQSVHRVPAVREVRGSSEGARRPSANTPRRARRQVPSSTGKRRSAHFSTRGGSSGVARPGLLPQAGNNSSGSARRTRLSALPGWTVHWPFPGLLSSAVELMSPGSFRTRCSESPWNASHLGGDRHLRGQPLHRTGSVEAFDGTGIDPRCTAHRLAGQSVLRDRGTITSSRTDLAATAISPTARERSFVQRDLAVFAPMVPRSAPCGRR